MTYNGEYSKMAKLGNILNVKCKLNNKKRPVYFVHFECLFCTPVTFDKIKNRNAVDFMNIFIGKDEEFFIN